MAASQVMANIVIPTDPRNGSNALADDLEFLAVHSVHSSNR